MRGGSSAARGKENAGGGPQPLPFDFAEEQRLQAALDAEQARREEVEKRLGSMVAEVGKAAGLEPTDVSSSAAEPTTDAQFGQLLQRLQAHAQEQQAMQEEQHFALQLAHKEKGMLESRAMLGRRHRTASATSLGLAATTSGPASPAPPAPADKAAAAMGTDKENTAAAVA